MVPATLESPEFNITGADLDRLRSEIAASIRTTLSKDVRHHVTEHVDKVRELGLVQSTLVLVSIVGKSVDAIAKLKNNHIESRAGSVQDPSIIHTTLAAFTSSRFCREIYRRSLISSFCAHNNALLLLDGVECVVAFSGSGFLLGYRAC